MHRVQAQTVTVFLFILALSSCVTINNNDGSVEATESNSSNPDAISASPAATQASSTSTALTSSTSPTATATTTDTPATTTPSPTATPSPSPSPSPSPTAIPTLEVLGTSSVGTYYITDTGGEGILPRVSCEQSAERSFVAAVPEGEKIKLILSGTNRCTGWMQVQAIAISETPFWVKSQYLGEAPLETTCNWEDTTAAAVDATVEIRVGSYSGTAFHMGDGYFYTAEHVIEGFRYALLQNHLITLKNVRVIKADSASDSALLKADLSNYPNFPSLTWGDSHKVKVGTEVRAVGYPPGVTSGEGSITAGIVSKNISDEDKIQTDAALNPGNSGGPLFNKCGEVLGIVISGRPDYDGIAYARSETRVRSVLESLSVGSGVWVASTPVPTATPIPTRVPTPIPTRVPTPVPPTVSTEPSPTPHPSIRCTPTVDCSFKLSGPDELLAGAIGIFEVTVWNNAGDRVNASYAMSVTYVSAMSQVGGAMLSDYSGLVQSTGTIKLRMPPAEGTGTIAVVYDGKVYASKSILYKPARYPGPNDSPPYVPYGVNAKPNTIVYASVDGLVCDSVLSDSEQQWFMRIETSCADDGAIVTFTNDGRVATSRFRIAEGDAIHLQ